MKDAIATAARAAGPRPRGMYISALPRILLVAVYSALRARSQLPQSETLPAVSSG